MIIQLGEEPTLQGTLAVFDGAKWALLPPPASSGLVLTSTASPPVLDPAMAWQAGGGSGGTPGGSSGQGQWNSSGAFAGMAGAVYDGSTNGYFPQIRGWTVGTTTAMAAGSGQFPALIMPFAGKLVKVQVVALTNPAGAAGGFSIQPLLNGTGVFSAPQAVAASTTTVQTFTTFTSSPLTVAAGDLFTFTPSSVGTGVMGVTVQLVFLTRNN